MFCYVFYLQINVFIIYACKDVLIAWFQFQFQLTVISLMLFESFDRHVVTTTHCCRQFTRCHQSRCAFRSCVLS